MAASTAASTVSLKLLIDTKSERVLFAEASKDFVDFLFNLLSLPIATVIRLLTKKQMVGSLANLYDSIEKLSDAYILPTTNKDVLLKPEVSSYGANVPLLLPNFQAPTTTTSIYRCSNNNRHSNCRSYYANNPTTTCPACSNIMNSILTPVNPPNEVSTSSAANEGGFVKGVVTYTILDDLSVTPMSTISSITMLSKFKVKEVGALQEKVINVGMNEGVELLKASLQSKTVLTDVFFKPKGLKIITK